MLPCLTSEYELGDRRYRSTIYGQNILSLYTVELYLTISKLGQFKFSSTSDYEFDTPNYRIQLQKLVSLNMNVQLLLNNT